MLSNQFTETSRQLICENTEVRIFIDKTSNTQMQNNLNWIAKIEQRQASAQFYHHCMKCLSERIDPDHRQSVLAVCGGEKDYKCLRSAPGGFSHIVISNLGDSPDGVPEECYVEHNAENIQEEDNSFDVVLSHAGLHHCARLHLVLCEMIRVTILPL